MKTLRVRLDALTQAAEASALVKGPTAIPDPEDLAIRALVRELPTPVLRVLAGQDVTLEDELTKLVRAGDKAGARELVQVVEELAGDPALTERMTAIAKGA